MTQSGLSFLSRFDPSEFYDIAKDLPSSLEFNEQFLEIKSDDTAATNDQMNVDVTQQVDDLTNINNNNNNNIEIIGTHLLLPQNSISQMLEGNQEFMDTTLIDFNTISTMLPNIGNIPAASNLPSHEPFSGIYNFKLNIISSDSPIKKSTPWTYSSQLNKLYSAPNTPCPINVMVSAIPPVSSVIRATAVYAKFEHIQDAITRCENHKKSKEFDQDPNDSLNEESSSHFVRSCHQMAMYTTDFNKRQSVVIPFERPAIGRNQTTLLYKFMCYSSCIGGSQKPVKIVLTLEHNNEILGRDSFEVKICACPGRDRMIDEKKLTKRKSTNIKVKIKDEIKDIKTPAIATPATTKTPAAINTQPPPAADLPKKNEIITIKSVTLPNENEKDDEIFVLKVRGRKNYEILKNLNEALEIQRLYASKMANGTVNDHTCNLVTDKPANGVQVLKKGSSFVFQNQKSQQTNVEPKKPIQSLDEFLQSIDMIAYFNLIVSKGLKTLEDLLNASKKKINGLKISQKDTDKLWSAVQNFKQKTPESNDHESENQSKKAKLDPKTISSFGKLFDFDQTQPSTNENNNYVKLSKYQIKCSFDLNKN